MAEREFGDIVETKSICPVCGGKTWIVDRFEAKRWLLCLGKVESDNDCVETKQIDEKDIVT